MKSNSLLKFAMALCLLFALTRLVEFIYAHVPPYKVGECYSVKHMPAMTVKILTNHVPDGYSDVEISFSGLTDKMPASFSDIREDLGEKVKCP